MRAHNRSVVSASMLCLIVAAAACEQRSADTREPDTRVLMELEADFARAVADRDLDRFMSFWAADAVNLPAMEPPQRTTDEIRAAWAPLFEESGVRLTWQPTHAEISASGDLGYTYGEYQLMRDDPDEGPRISVGKYTTIWRKGADGRWQVVLDTGSPNQPPGP